MFAIVSALSDELVYYFDKLIEIGKKRNKHIVLIP